MIDIRRPTVNDVDSIFKLINKMADKGLMLHRSKYKIVTTLGNFLVAEDLEKGKIVGCGAFSLLWTDLGEIMSLAIDNEYQNMKIGSRLVKALLEYGKKIKVPEIITLTYKPEFFKKLGFIMVNKDRFPRKLWRECLECPKLEQCDETILHILLD